tara:strand:- start:1723 stop:1959 length:237 start_codon:yes stop_codon:yes gene_type:complete
MYVGEEYQRVAEDEKSILGYLMSQRGGSGRFGSLANTFKKETRLEVGFWQMAVPLSACLGRANLMETVDLLEDAHFKI